MFNSSGIVLNNESSSYEEKLEKVNKEGVFFEKMLMKRAFRKAEDDGKNLFVFCTTSWVSPGKKMKKKVFVDKELGNLYNEKFICLDVDVEMDVDGPEIVKRFEIRKFPTMLILDSEGNILNKLVGYKTIEQLLLFGNSIE